LFEFIVHLFVWRQLDALPIMILKAVQTR